MEIQAFAFSRVSMYMVVRLNFVPEFGWKYRYWLLGVGEHVHGCAVTIALKDIVHIPAASMCTRDCRH